MQGPSLVSCIDVSRRGEILGDTYNRVIDIPKSSHHNNLIQLPSFIPGVAGGVSLLGLDADGLVAVSLGDIIGSDGDLLVANITQVKRRFRLPSKSRVALIGTAKDSILERLWKISDTHDIWKRISEVGFDWVTSLTYSVWDEMPRADQIRNQDRNFQTHDFFTNLGLPCIPFLFPIDKEDYIAAGGWMGERPDIKMVAIEAQYYKRSYQIARLAEDMRAIESAAQRHLQFLVVGTATASSIETLMRQFSTAVVTWKPFHRGRTGSYCNRNLAYFESSLPKEELVPLNFQQYDAFCRELGKERVKAA
jgi:hypothetical protein